MTTNESGQVLPRVYLIDDDPVATFLLVDLVESVDLPYVVFESAVKFLERATADLQGCVVSDLRMPGMSGLELQDELHNRGVNLPIIFISAYAEVHLVVRAMRGGALDFFQKPFPSQPLIERIQQGLRIDKERAELQSRNREIGERMITHDPDITRLLNRLEDRGLVERTRARHDRRVIYGKITAAGLKLLRTMDNPIEKHGREILRHVGQEKLKQLIDLLELVRCGKALHRGDAESVQ